jgi:DNA helicase-2/ATP-dependent DNA helicase PcrA
MASGEANFELLMQDFPPYLDKLNEPQRGAVMHTEGPVMIVAGAGSGKTRVLTFRIAHLLKSGADPFSILALTFTNKAAREMRERIEKLVGAEARNLWMGTFHSVFARILRMEAEKISYPRDFTIYDSDDSKSLIKTILKEWNLDDKTYKPGNVLSRISMAKNNLIAASDYNNAEELTGEDRKAGRARFGELFAEYEARCKRAGAMDFDDILLNTEKLLRLHPDVCHKWQHKFKYVMLDEYQDTNRVQYMITKRLAAVHQNICVVGDDAQSIYSFRGANIQNILSFERDYPDARVFKLEQNYRSTQNIVQAAGSIIKNNKHQLKKNVWTSNEPGEKIKVVRNLSDNEEGRWVAQNIFEEKMRQQLPNKAFAILYRTNAQSRSFEEGLRRLNLDYKVYGGVSFYQRKEIKDVLAYLRLIINPTDEEALKRIINYPARKIGATTIDRIILLASENACSLWDIVCNARKYPVLGSATLAIDNFSIMMRSFQAMLATHNAYNLALHVAKQTGLLKTLGEDKTVEGISKYENVVELLSGIQEFVEDDTSESEKGLSEFLQEVALFTDERKEDDPNRDTITLMTIHASKGLEFPFVYVVGMEENLFPSQMALNDRQDLEEERRLFYVAVTRAERKLTLSFATSRLRFGQILPCEPSRFIEEIDPIYLDMDLAGLKKQSPVVRDEPQFSSFQLKRSTGTPRMSTATPPPDPNFQEDDISNLSAGMKIQHQRFGFGEVLSVDGADDQRKAIIKFDAYGEKTLVLKFAKMRIVSGA